MPVFLVFAPEAAHVEIFLEQTFLVNCQRLWSLYDDTNVQISAALIVGIRETTSG